MSVRAMVTTTAAGARSGHRPLFTCACLTLVLRSSHHPNPTPPTPFPSSLNPSTTFADSPFPHARLLATHTYDVSSHDAAVAAIILPLLFHRHGLDVRRQQLHLPRNPPTSSRGLLRHRPPLTYHPAPLPKSCTRCFSTRHDATGYTRCRRAWRTQTSGREAADMGCLARPATPK